MPARRFAVVPQGGGVVPQTAIPTFSPLAGSYVGPQLVSISSATLGAAIFFTIDGSTPTIASPLYTGPITVPSNETINAVALANGYALSPVGSAAYTISSPQTATPAFSPVAGTYGSAQSVTISCTTPSSSIFYTTDGSTPTIASTPFVSPIAVGTNQTLKAIATASGFTASAVATAAYVISAAPVVITPLIKFMPGDTMSAGFNGGTVNYVDGANNYPVSADVNAALSVCFRANHANVRGFFPWFRAPALEPTQGNYLFDGSATDPILSAYKAVQAEYRRANGGIGDQGIFGFGIAHGTNTTAGQNQTPAQVAAFTFNGSSGPAAPWIRDCVINGNTVLYNGRTCGRIDVFNTVRATLQLNGPTIWVPGGATTSYPLAIQVGASQQCGYGYAGWDGTGFITCYPTTWEIGHGKARQNFWQALTQYYKLPFTSSSGVTTWFTLNDHPLVGLVWCLDEVSPGFNVGTKPISSDAINYPNGNFLSATGYWAEKFAWYSIISPAAPKLQMGDSYNFLFQTGAADDDTHSSYNARFAQISSQWKNIVLIGPDTYSGAFSTTWSATDAQQNYMGVVPSAATPGTINPLLSYQAKMGNWMQAQDLDWSHHVAGGSGNFYSTTCGQGIITAANGNSNTPGQIGMCSGNRMWYFRTDRGLNSDWATPIFASFSGTFGQVTTPVNTQRPTNFMAGMTINSVAVASSSSLTVSCTLPVLDPFETGLTFPVYRNGVQVGVLNGGGTFTDTGRSTATPYTYTVGMLNANGPGPQGPAVVGEIAGQVFSFANFSGSPNIHTGPGGAAVSGGTINFPNASHNGGGAWYGAGVQNIQSFTTDFTFVIPSIENYGMFFVIQNCNPTTNPFASGINAGGNSANGIGYGAGGSAAQPALANSVGLGFITSSFNQSGTYFTPQPWSAIALCVDGGPAIGGGTFGSTNGCGFAPVIDTHPLGFNVGSNNLLHCFLTYDGTTLTMVLTDTVSLATIRLSWPVNIPNIVGGNTAFIGFCQSQAGVGPGPVTINSWNYALGFNTRLAAPTFSVPAGQYSGTQTVALSGPVGASIRYTTNGIPPTSASTLYISPITVSATQYIQAVALQSGFTDSPVAQALYSIQASATPVINFPSGFASAGGLIQCVGTATISAGNISLVDTLQAVESGGAWFTPKVSMTNFNHVLTLNVSSLAGSGAGFCFMLQNYPQTDTGTNFNWNLGNGPFGVTVVSGGPYTLNSPLNGGSASSLGYVQLFNSIGICVNLAANSVGLYTNGTFPGGSQVAITGGINFASATPIMMTIAYNGTALTVKFAQGANTSPIITLNASINIPSILGSNTGWAGFDAVTGNFGSALANVKVSTWSM